MSESHETHEPEPALGRGAMDRLRLVVVGHVDHGKSTLIGRLLLDTGSFLEGKYRAAGCRRRRRGVPFELANLTDALQAERDQNVTIDTAQVWFRTERREYVLIDAPGHREFVKNMVTGAATADAALIVVDANEGVQEQSRRHGYLLKLLGVTQVAVIVNKLDCVDYSAVVFERTAAEYGEFLSRIGVRAQISVPVSAVHGDNVANRSINTPWYDGPLVVDVLDAFQAPVADAHAPLRLPVQDVYRFDARRIIVGRVESGTVSVGDRLLFLPSGKQSTVKTIERWNAAENAPGVGGGCDRGDAHGAAIPRSRRGRIKAARCTDSHSRVHCQAVLARASTACQRSEVQIPAGHSRVGRRGPASESCRRRCDVGETGATMNSPQTASRT